jgi:glycosyltransferase involved in cell wall biosynthesis
MPTVSVLLPVHDAMPHLPEALGSLLAQEGVDFEVIALDDASTDDGGAYLDGVRDARLRVLHLPRMGLTRALNVGLRESAAPLVARMDADDVSLPGRLAAQRRFLDADPGVVVVGCQAEVIDGEGRRQSDWNFPADDLGIKLMLARDETPLLHPGVMARREAVMAVGGYDESLACAQDRDLWWRLIDRGRFANLPEALVRYRRHGASVTGRRSEEQLRLADAMTRRHLAGFGVVRDDDQYRAYRAVDRALREFRPGEVAEADLGAYVGVIDRLLRLLAGRCGADPAAVLAARRERWRQLAGRAWRARGASGVVACLPLLHRLAPGEHRPDRLARALAGALGRRAARAWRRPGRAAPARGGPVADRTEGEVLA